MIRCGQGCRSTTHQVRWSISPCEDRPTGAYVSVEARLDCGCEVKDLKTFARHMRDQRGWDIATTARLGNLQPHLGRPRTPYVHLQNPPPKPRLISYFRGLLGYSVDVEDALDRADCLQDVAQVGGIAHFEGEAGFGYAVSGGRQGGREGC